MIRKWAYIPALMATCILPLQARDIFVTPTSSSSNTIGVYQADPLTSVGSINGPVGVFKILRASANKFYFISAAVENTVTVWGGTLPGITQSKQFNLSQPATAAAISPDGRRVVVLAGNVYIFDTATDNLLTPTGVAAGTSPNAVTISPDSTFAFVVSGQTQRITSIDLNTSTAGNSSATPGAVSQIATAPNGFIYATAVNALLEYDPRTLTNTNAYPLNADPSLMAFTPDGRNALLINRTPVTGSSLINVDLVRKSFVVAPPIGGAATLQDVVVTSNNTVYTFSQQTGRLYSTQLTSGSDAALTLTPVTFGSVAVEGITDIAASTEVPAKYLLVTTPIGLFRRDSSGSMTGPIPLTPIGNLTVNSAPTTSGGSVATAINNNQTIAPGQGSLPLVVRVTDAAGNPVSTAPVMFTADSGATVVNAMPQTNNEGLAVAYVNPPAGVSAATINVTAVVAGIASPAVFTINIGTGGGGGGPTTSGLRIISGNGQALSANTNTQFQEPMRVRLSTAAGVPISGATVRWTRTQGGGDVQTPVSTTDVSGNATTSFQASSVLGGRSYETSVITASTETESVTFYVTTLGSVPGGGPGTLNSYPQQSSNVVQGRAGDTLPGAIQYRVVSPLGEPLQYIGIRVESDITDAEGNPVASCRGGTQLSDNAGLASCDLTISSNFIGEANLTVVVGSVRRDPYVLRVIAGAPTSARIIQGGGQTGAAGQLLPQALVAEIIDSTGSLARNVPVTWEVSPAGSATLSNTSTQTGEDGRAATNVTLGQRPGTVQVRVIAGAATGTFSLNVNPRATSIAATGGNNQSAGVGQAFSQPLTVTVTNEGQPVAGARVTYSIVSGSMPVTLSSDAATTNAQGVASITATAGSTIGAATVRAQAGILTTDFNLTVRPAGPGFTAANVLNAAGFQQGISPGTIAAINATGIAPNPGTVAAPAGGPLPTTLANVQVLFNGLAVPIFAVANVNGQESVTVQVPFEAAPGTASVTIRLAGGGETTVSGVQILPVKPGLFEVVDTGNQRIVQATRPDGTYVSSGNPARRGEIIRVYATGLGQTTPATGTNRLGQSGQDVMLPVIVGVNNAGVRLITARLLPGVIGVYYVDFEVPADTTPGAGRPFVIAVADGTSTVFSNATTIPIQ